MTDRDLAIAEALDRLVPPGVGSADWSAIVRDAGVRARRRLLGALVPAGAVLAVAATALLWPFGGEQRGVLDRALAAVGDGPVLHIVFRGDWGGTLFDLQSGERRPVYAEQEIWFDSNRNLVHQIDRLGGAVESESVGELRKPPPDLASLSTEYRHALVAGTARVAEEGVLEGDPVYWIVYRSEMLPDVADNRLHEFTQQIAVSKKTFKPVALRDARDGQSPPGGTRRVLKLETVSSEEADFTASAANAIENVAVKMGGEPITLEAAQDAVGQTPLWLGRDYAGHPLAHVSKTVTAMAHPTETEVHGQLAADAKECLAQEPPKAGRSGPACERMHAAGYGFSVHDGHVYKIGRSVWGPDQTGLALFYGTIGDDPGTYKEDRLPRYDQPHVKVTESTHSSRSMHGGARGYVPPDGSVFLAAGGTGLLHRDGLFVTIEASTDEAVLSAARALEPMPG